MTQRLGLRWISLPHPARLYVASMIAAGTCVFAASFPRAYPRPGLFAVLLVTGCLTSIWKVNLPIAPSSGSTLSMSYAADLTALLLLGPQQAMVIAVVGVLAQCTLNIRHPYPVYRTGFSMSAEAIAIVATGAVYGWLGGWSGPLVVSAIAKPLVGAIATYFVFNTGLVAGAIALSTGRSAWRVWYDDFLWSGASFMVAGTAGAIAAVVIDRGQQWLAVVTLPPGFFTYCRYQNFLNPLQLLQRGKAGPRGARQGKPTE